MPFPPPGNLPDPGTEPESPVSPALAGILYHCATGEAMARITFLKTQSLHFPSWLKFFSASLTAIAHQVQISYHSTYDSLINCPTSIGDSLIVSPALYSLNTYFLSTTTCHKLFQTLRVCVCVCVCVRMSKQKASIHKTKNKPWALKPHWGQVGNTYSK